MLHVFTTQNRFLVKYHFINVLLPTCPLQELSTADLFTFMTAFKSGLRCSRHGGVCSMLPNTLNSANLPCTASPARLYALILIYVCVFSSGPKILKITPKRRAALVWLVTLIKMLFGRWEEAGRGKH